MDLKNASVGLDRIERRHSFDAIVVGAGAAGGLAAAELTKAGLEVLVLDAGWVAPFWQRPITRTLNGTVQLLANPAALKYIPSKLAWKGRETLKQFGKLRQPIQSRCYAWEGLPNGFVDDRDSPYETPEGKPFNWIRARGIGGRMVVPAHGKQYLRHGPCDFAPLDDLSPAWPLQPGELDPWYTHVEQLLNLKGQTNGSPWIPDSLIAETLAPDPAQSFMMEKISETWAGASPMLGRYTEPVDTMQRAAETGRLSWRGAAIAHSILTQNGNSAGVRFFDQAAGRLVEAKAKTVFLCASSLETTRLLLNSRAKGVLAEAGSDTGALGRYIMDHVSVKAEGLMPDNGIADQSFNLGNCVYIPRFERRDGSTSSTRGYGMRLYQVPGPGDKSYFTAVSDAEMLPRRDNFVRLSERKDRWGIPILHISCAISNAEAELAKKQSEAVLEVSDLFGATLTSRDLAPSIPGAAIHEVGGARMGSDPRSSVVDQNNECWDIRGLYVTDGAAFPSIGIQNPTLTIMALTARACAHAAK